MNDKLANDLIRYAELVEDSALISPEEMNCASVMRLAAEYLAQPAQPEHSATHGEPVAWYHPENDRTYFTAYPDKNMIKNGYWQPLYKKGKL